MGKRVEKNKRKLSPARVQEVVNHATLCALGLREAYLLEGLTMDPTELKLILQEKLCSHDLDREHSLCIIQLGFADLIIVNIKTLISKLYLLRTDSDGWELMNQPLLVNLNGHEPTSLCMEEDRKSLAALILHAFGYRMTIDDCEVKLLDDESVFHVKTIQIAEDDELENIGYPFLAGWLLGYSCIYHCTTGNGAALSHQELEKISIKITTGVSPPLPIMEFTYPTKVFLEKTQREVFQKAVKEKLANITKCANTAASTRVLGSPTNITISMDKSHHYLTSISL